MTIIIDAPAEIEAAIMEKATLAGLSVSEYTLRALLTTESAAGPSPAAQDPPVLHDREARRRAAMELARSGHFARTGLSTEALFADRREDLRLEAEQEARRLAAREAAPA